MCAFYKIHFGDSIQNRLAKALIRCRESSVCELSHSVLSDSLWLWTVAHQAPLCMGFSRQEYQSGLLCPSPGHLPNPRTEPSSFMSLALAGGFFTTSTTILKS